MYVIKCQDGSYFHKGGKIILFETEQEINEFVNCFVQYSVNRLMSEGRQHDAMSAPIQIMTSSRAMPLDFDIDNVVCGVVYARDLRI